MRLDEPTPEQDTTPPGDPAPEGQDQADTAAAEQAHEAAEAGQDTPATEE